MALMAKEEKEFITSAPFLLLFLKPVLLQAPCCVYFYSHWAVNLVYILIISRKWQNGTHFSASGTSDFPWFEEELHQAAENHKSGLLAVAGF